MARITVEDCLNNVENRFELVMVASKRARQIATGGKLPLVDEDGDKPTVIALREIEQGLITDEVLREAELESNEYEEEVAAAVDADVEAIGNILAEATNLNQGDIDTSNPDSEL